jgi:hypothetical protein
MRSLSFGSRLVAAMGALACASVAFALPAGAGGNSGRELLTMVQDFVDDAESVEYSGEIESEYADPFGSPSSIVDRGTLEESARFPNRGRSVVDLAGFVTETLYIKKDVYIRDGDSIAQLEDARFGKLDPERPGATSGVPGEFFLFERPQDLGDALQAAQRPAIGRERNGLTLLEVSFPPTEILPIVGGVFEEAAGELAIASDGELRRLKLTATGPDERLEVTLTFERWNDKVKIEAPKRADLDPTPTLDEESVAEFNDVPLLQPAAIPEGWVLDFADVLSAEETPEGCDQVEVDYVDPLDEFAGFVYVYIFPTACASGAPGDSEEFIAGPHRGFIGQDPTFATDVIAQLDVNGTTLQIISDLSKDQLAALFAELVPLDLASPPPATLVLPAA